MYDRIVIISPTYLLQAVWKSLDPAGIDVYLEYNCAVIAQLMSQQTNNPNSNLLVIFDDLSADIARDKLSKKILNKFICNSRHLRTSLIWLAQKLTQIPTWARTNADTFVSFSSLSTREKDSLYAEIGVIDRKDFDKMFTQATAQPYTYFVATFKDGHIRYFASSKEIK